MNSCKGLCEEVSKLVSCRDVMDRDSTVFDLVATIEIANVDMLGSVAESGL